jgi:predicted porin
MIKVFLGSMIFFAVGAAMIAPAMAEGEANLGLGGYYETFFWADDGSESTGSRRDLSATSPLAVSIAEPGTRTNLLEDAQGTRYVLPRISGFQIGLSRDPAPATKDDGAAVPLRSTLNGELRDLLSVNASYIDSFVGFDLAVTAGYGLTTDDADGIYDPQHYSAGVDVGISNFTVGGALGVGDGGRVGDGIAWDAGATYSVGPWMIGASYFHGSAEGGGGGEDELDALQSGVSYAFGPGITARANVLWTEWDGADGDSSAGFGGVLGMQVGF